MNEIYILHLPLGTFCQVAPTTPTEFIKAMFLRRGVQREKIALLISYAPFPGQLVDKQEILLFVCSSSFIKEKLSSKQSDYSPRRTT